MMKTLLATLLAFTLLGAMASSAALAQQAGPHHRLLKARGHVHADGRCGGISYGTGARSCGTATGGPVGGLSSRN